MTIKEAERILYEKTPMGDIYTTTYREDYIEFLGDVNGDTITYRIYQDGKVIEV